MIKTKVQTRFDPRKLKQAVGRANFRGLGHAGAAIRLTARRLIRKSPRKSVPGTPPHTRKGRLRGAIKYALTPGKQSVVIGPDYAVAADAGAAHEFGGRFRSEFYPKRAFMGPALEKVKDRLPRIWAASVRP